MNRIYLTIFLFGFALPFISARENKFFRKDYTYIAELDAFYKVHWDVNGNQWNNAFLACNDEEANLFYPKDKEEWGSVKSLMESLKEKPNVTDIFVGFHNKFNLGEFITVDGHATPYPLLLKEAVTDDTVNECIVMSTETGEFHIRQCLRPPDSPLPFICKKVEKNDVTTCPTVDKGYKYSKDVRRCYKVNKTPKLWSEAVRTCYMEGGMLVVVESNEERYAVEVLMEREIKYSSGFRKLYPRNEYYTVAGQIFKGEIQHEPPPPRNYDYNIDGEIEPVQPVQVEINNICGAIRKYDIATSTTGSCDFPQPFICQMELSKD